MTLPVSFGAATHGSRPAPFDTTALKKYNHIMQRIQWVRDNLEISPKEVYMALGIPQQTFHYIEQNNSGNPETILKIAQFLDDLWQTRYEKHQTYPWYKGAPMREVTFTWLMVGKDPYRARYDFGL